MSTFLSVTLEVGELPESIDGGPGIAKSLADHIESLDSMASGLGLRPLGQFMVDYASQMEDFFAEEGNDDIEDIEKAMAGLGDSGPWFNPEEGIATVLGLIQKVQSSPDAANLLVILKSMEQELEYAKQRGSRFHLSLTE
jgi:hypothetical protein